MSTTPNVHQGTLWVWRGLGGALWCVSSAGGRQQSTLSKRLQVNCEVSRRAELDMWSHVVRRHMCLSSTFSKPSLLFQAHFGSVLLSLPISWLGATCSTGIGFTFEKHLKESTRKMKLTRKFFTCILIHELLQDLKCYNFCAIRSVCT